MKRLVLVSVIALAAGAGLLELIRRDTGYVLVALGNTTIEMSFWVAVAVVLAAVLLLWLTLFILRRLLGLVSGSVHVLANRRSRRVEERTASGLIFFIENNWRAARRDLLRAARHARNPLVHYLAAARCSYELGERDETQRLLHRAEQIAPRNELAVVLSQARIQLLDKKYEQCLATLKRARALSPQHPTVLDLLREVYWQLRDWQSLQALLPELRKQKLYREEEQKLLEQNVYMALLSSAGKQAEKVRANGAGKTESEAAARQVLTDAWQSLPKNVRSQNAVVGLYARLLLEAQLPDTAEKLLRQQLADGWDAQLVKLYGLVPAPAPREQLAVAEQWLRQRPGEAELLLALGRISLRNQLWGKARDYFESSLKLRPEPETYAELARLLAYLGEHERSTELYQKGLLSSTHGLPALPMPEKKLPVESRELEDDADPMVRHLQ